MIESLIVLLIYVAIFALVVWLILWVLGIIGVSLPPRVVQIIWVIFALVVLLMIVRAMLPASGGLRLSGILPLLVG